MNFKRVFSLLTAMLLLMSVLCVGFSASAAGFTCTVSELQAAPGTTVQVPITLENNPGVWGFKIKVGFDDSLTLKQAINTAAVYSQAEVMFGPIDNNPFTFTGEYTDLAANNTKNGILFVMEFEVSEKAKVGDVLEIAVKNYDPDDVFNNEFKNQTCTIVNGSITVVAADKAPENPTYEGNQYAGVTQDENQFASDENGNYITDANGNYVTRSADDTNAVEIGSKSGDEETQGGSNIFIYIVLAIIAVALIAVVIVLMTSKKNGGTPPPTSGNANNTTK